MADSGANVDAWIQVHPMMFDEERSGLVFYEHNEQYLKTKIFRAKVRTQTDTVLPLFQ